MACFDGEYPIGLPAGHLIGKHVLEGVERRVAAEQPARREHEAGTGPVTADAGGDRARRG
jgi:amidophosphoribosyltransferase